MLYLWAKWLHIISVISWMAGILYLYRLLVYHSERGLGQEQTHDLLSVMEKRLYRFIALPAMALSWLAGIVLVAVQPLYLKAGWMHAKFLMVIGLTGATHYAGALVKRFSTRQSNLPKGKTLRFLNELPTVLMMIIVGLVVFKSF